MMYTIMESKYTLVKIPKGLAEKIDDCLKKHPEYASRSELIRTAIRDYINLLDNCKNGNCFHNSLNSKC